MALQYHEPTDELSTETREVHRAIASLIEELEAIDWYQQRVDATHDEDLRRILAHNRDEEVEHASMTLEWLRRRVPKFDEELRTYLFTDQSLEAMVTEEGHGGGDEDSSAKTTSGDLRIGRNVRG